MRVVRLPPKRMTMRTLFLCARSIRARRGGSLQWPIVNEYKADREQRERRRRMIVRTVCIVIAASMLLSLVIPAIYAGL